MGMMLKYECLCNDCDHEWGETSESKLTYADVTCPNCGAYESVFLTLINVKEILTKIIAEELQIKDDDVLGEDSLNSLGADSLDTVTILMKVEEELGIDIEDATDATSNEKVDEIVFKIEKLITGD